MAVTSEVPIASSVANGVTTVFPHSFTVLDDGDLVVTGTVSNVTTTYTLGVDYTVSGVGSASGSVTFVTPPANGTIVTRYRDIALIRETDYQDNGDLLADVLNADMDRLVFMLQDIFNGGKVVPTCVRAPNGETLDALPAAASRAGYYLGFDSNGQPILLAASTGTAAALASDLVNNSDAIKGARLVAYNPTLTYASGLGEFLNRLYARTAGEVSAGVTPTNYHFPPGDVRRYGADPTGVSNSLTAWQAAFASSKEVYAPSGTYEFGSVSGGTTMINLTTRGNDITLRTGRGVKLRCTTTGASGIPYFFQLDNNSRCTFGDLEFEDLGGDNTITWKGAFGFYLTNATPTNWGNLKFGAITCTKLVAPIAAQATGSATNRIRNIVVDQINLTDCYYGPLLQNDGDDATFHQVNANGCVRPLFVYGVSGIRAKIFNRNNLGTSGAVHISRQTGGQNTSDIRINYVGRDAALNATHVLLSHSDISGGEINNVDVTVDLEGSAVYNSVRFVTYNSGSEYATATNNIFSNITIRGRSDSNAGTVQTPSAFNTKGRLWFYGSTNLTLAQSILNQFRVGYTANGSTPTWASSGTQPAIGNGTLTSSFAVTDGVCVETFRITMGSTTTYGTGDWTLSTAFPATQTAIGSLYMKDASGNHWTGICRLASGAQAISMYADNVANGVSATVPFTWANTDFLEATISYRIAQ